MRGLRQVFKNYQLKYAFLFILPAVIVLVAIGLAPFFYVLVLSFHKYRLTWTNRPWVFIGLDNYRYVMNWDRFWHAAWNTIIFSFGSTTLSFLVGFSLALFLSRRFRGRGILRAIVIIPLLIPPVSVGLMWRFLLHPLLGLIPWIIKSLTGITVSFFETGEMAMLSLILIDTWEWFPFMFLVLLAGLESLPKEPFEAAYVDGASRLQIFRHITLPLMRPVIAVAYLLKFLISLKVYDIIYTVTTGGPGTATETLSYLIYRQTFAYFWVDLGSSMALIYEYMIILFAVVFVRYALIKARV